jgi:OmpA-OmpF porin, OOP family
MKLMYVFGAVATVALAACSGPQPPAAPVVAAATPATPPAPAKASAESLSIAFAEGSTKLSPEALSQLDGAARLYRDAHPEVMIVSGHTDPSGAEFPNLILSAHRAASVKTALVERGVPADRLQIVAVGQAQPVPTVTPDKVAVITWR